MESDKLTNNTAHAFELTSNVILHVCFFSLFVGFFFFVVAARVEKTIVQNQVQGTVQSLVRELKQVLSPTQRAALSAQVATLNPPDMKQEDGAVSSGNQKLVRDAFTALGPIFVVGLLVVVAMFLVRRASGKKKGIQKNAAGYNLGTLFAHNLLILFFVAVTETLFLFSVAYNYRSLDPQVVKRTIVNTLLSFSNNNSA